MKSKKILAFLMALSMVSAGAIAVSAAGEPADTTAAPADTTAAETTAAETTAAETTAAETTAAETQAPAAAYSLETLYGVTYKVYPTYAEVSSVDPSLAEVTIANKVGDVKVTDYDPEFIAEATKLAKINVSVNNETFRSIGGVFMKFTKTTEKKDGKDVDVYHDTLLLYPPAGAKSYVLPSTVEDIYSSAFKYSKDVKVGVPKDHGTWIAANDNIYEYTSKTTIKADGSTSTEKEVNQTPKYKGEDYKVKFVSVSATATTGSTSGSTSGSSSGDAPAGTGSTGVGVALATLLATGATAVVLRKRGRK